MVTFTKIEECSKPSEGSVAHKKHAVYWPVGPLDCGFASLGQIQDSEGWIKTAGVFRPSDCGA